MIPRWSGDGLEKHAQSMRERNEVYDISNPSVLQKTLTELLGGWSSPRRLEDMPPNAQSLFLNLPFTVQQRAAEEFQNFEAAIDHLFDVCDNDDAKSLLRSIDAFGAVKYGKVGY